MKPRIRQSRTIGLWLCSTPETFSGLGFNPKHAYDDWLMTALECNPEEAQ